MLAPRDTYCRQLEDRLATLDAQMADLERAEEAERVATPGHPPSSELADLRARRDDVSRHLARCQFVEQDDWHTAHSAAEESWAAVADAFERALVRFRGRGSGGS